MSKAAALLLRGLIPNRSEAPAKEAEAAAVGVGGAVEVDAVFLDTLRFLSGG